MPTDIGEYVVGAYLKLIERCDVIDYNVRPTGGGMRGLEEFDVVGFNFTTNSVYLCEVATHLGGLLYGDGNDDTVTAITKKFERQKQYAKDYLGQFDGHRYMFWSPNVPVGAVTEQLEALATLELIINGEYKRRVGELRELAAKQTQDMQNPFFRALQILEHLRD